MGIDDMEQDLLNGYREFHDLLSKTIEEGGVDIVALSDYTAIVEALADLAAEGDRLNKALEEESGL